MPHTVIGSEQRRRSGRSLSWRLSWRLSSRTCRVRYTISVPPPPPGSGARYLKLRYAGPVRGLCVSVVRVHLHARLLERVHMPRIRLFGCGSGGPCRGHTCCARHRVRFEWLAVQTTIRDRGPLRGTSRSPGRRALWRPLRRGLLIPHGSQARPSPFSRGSCAQHGFHSCRCCGAAAPEALMEAHGRITAQTTVLDL